MDELLKIITPQNFAMIIAIYLLVRFEKVITALQESLDRMGERFTGSIDRNTRVLSLVILKNLENADEKGKATLQELLDCSVTGNGKKEG